MVRESTQTIPVSLCSKQMYTVHKKCKHTHSFQIDAMCKYMYHSTAYSVMYTHVNVHVFTSSSTSDTRRRVLLMVANVFPSCCLMSPLFSKCCRLIKCWYPQPYTTVQHTYSNFSVRTRTCTICVCTVHIIKVHWCIIYMQTPKYMYMYMYMVGATCTLCGYP